MFIAIVPAYNEEKKIGSVIRDLFGHVDRVVVVDDASTDRTVTVAKEAGATVISHEVNRGQGAALETGHAYARSVGATYVLHFDGDGQFDVSDILPALKKMQSTGADVLLGTRFKDGRSNTPFVKKYILHPAGKILNRLVTGMRLSDAHNGFRILSARALDRMTLQQDRMAHATEVLSEIKKQELTLVEFPVKVTYHEFGQGALGGISIVRDLIAGSFIRK